MWRGLFFFLATMVVAGCSPETIDKILNPPFLTGYGQDVGDDSVSGTLDTIAAVDDDSNGVTDDVPVVCPDLPPPFAEGKRMACIEYDPILYCTIEKESDCTWGCRQDDGTIIFNPVPAQYLPNWCKVGTP